MQKSGLKRGTLASKGSNAHKARVVRDTAGLSLNMMLKLMSVISLLLVPVFVIIGGGLI
jgi:K(+)-stimulated pyrophosphate-energized sodium pump